MAAAVAGPEQLGMFGCFGLTRRENCLRNAAQILRARERTARRPERTGAPWEAAKDKDSAVVILRASTLWLVAPESRDESLNRRVFPWLDVFEPEL